MGNQDLLDLLERVESIQRRLDLIHGEMAEAERLQAVDRWRHLVVVSGRVNGWGENSVASSWPYPPYHARPIATVSTDGRL